MSKSGIPRPAPASRRNVGERQGKDAAKSDRIKDALYQLTDRLHGARSPDDVYHAALQAITTALRCDRASILLFDNTGTMRFTGWHGLSDGYRKAVEGHSPWKLGEENPQPICIPDVGVADIDASLKATVKAEGIGALAFIPLVASGQLIGKFMTYFNTPRPFTHEDSELSLTIAHQLAASIEHKRAEQAMAHLAAIVASSSDAILSKTLDGIVTSWNQSAERMFGYTAPEIVGQSILMLIPPERRMEEDHILARLRAGERIEHYETVRVAKNGRRLNVALTISPVKDSSGRITGASKIARDITERKRAEELLRAHAQQLALITDTALVFIAQCDSQHRYKFVNKAYANRFGVMPQDCIGKRLPEVIGESAYKSFRKYIEIVLRGEPVEFDIAVDYASIGEHYMHCSYSPERDATGRVVGWVGVVIDITERKRVERALMRSEEQLKDADRRKDEFLAMLAHELRNPLAPIANAVHLLHQDHGDPRVQQQARAIIERQTARLARLVDELLEVSRITTGRIRLHMEQVALSGVVERAVETVRPLVEQHQHALVVSLPPQPVWLHADVTRLEQVLVNLLNNAAKYTDDGGRIDLTIRTELNDVVLTVRDNGIGIDKDLLPRVFDLFTQAERSLDRSRGGLGIGLSLVQRLVSMHAGTVTAKSVVGEGSEFVVRLPLADPPASRTQAPTRQTNGTTLHPLRVLVVDDNVDAAQSLAMLLEVSGHVAWMAHDGATALDAAREYRPQVVFLDIGLPKLDGYEVAKQLRQDATADEVVIVAMTGYGQAADRARALDAGFDHHLVKPVDYSHVERVLKNVPTTTLS
jgi:PAS domain S-box-containing protein